MVFSYCLPVECHDYHRQLKPMANEACEYRWVNIISANTVEETEGRSGILRSRGVMGA